MNKYMNKINYLNSFNNRNKMNRMFRAATAKIQLNLYEEPLLLLR